MQRTRGVADRWVTVYKRREAAATTERIWS